MANFFRSEAEKGAGAEHYHWPARQADFPNLPFVTSL